jgi:hypothetical protein
MTNLVASLTLITAFSLLAVSSSLLIIFSKKFIRALGIALMSVTIVFGAFLYEAPKYYMGWATVEEPADGCYIRDIIFVEPKPEQPGAIYLLGFVKIEDRNHPRLYKLPYSRETHEELVKKRGKADRIGGLLQYRKGKRGSKDTIGGEKDESGYRVIEPPSEEHKSQ